MAKGTVRVTFRLPYDTDNAKFYEGVVGEPTNHEQLLEAMARYDVETCPDATLDNLDYMSIEFDGWSE